MGRILWLPSDGVLWNIMYYHSKQSTATELVTCLPNNNVLWNIMCYHSNGSIAMGMVAWLHSKEVLWYIMWYHTNQPIATKLITYLPGNDVLSNVTCYHSNRSLGTGMVMWLPNNDAIWDVTCFHSSRSLAIEFGCLAFYEQDKYVKSRILLSSDNNLFVLFQTVMSIALKRTLKYTYVGSLLQPWTFESIQRSLMKYTLKCIVRHSSSLYMLVKFRSSYLYDEVIFESGMVR